MLVLLVLVLVLVGMNTAAARADNGVVEVDAADVDIQGSSRWSLFVEGMLDTLVGGVVGKWTVAGVAGVGCGMFC